MNTIAQRKYDQDLTKAMRNLAQNVLPRSRKIHDTLKLAADRLDDLIMRVPLEAAQNQFDNQPASNKQDQAQQKSLNL